MLIDQIESDLTSALKNQDEMTLSVLRMLKSAIKNSEIQKQKELNDEDVATIIQSQIKSRRDSVEMYKTGGREELAEKEEKEIEILKKYLPKQMSEEDIRAIVKKVIVDTNAAQISDMGKVMGKVMPELKGKAEGGTISKIVKEELTSKS